MTISISTLAFYELLQETVEQSQQPDPDDALDKMFKFPQLLGQGYLRQIESQQGLRLEIADYQLHNDLTMEDSDGESFIEYIFFLSGGSKLTSPLVDTEQHTSRGQYAFWGSGFIPEHTIAEPRVEPMLWVDVFMEPELLRSSIGNSSEELPSELHRTDASIFYRRDRFRAALNFNNLFNVEYFESALRSNVFYGDPFTVQGTISWQF